MTPTSQHEVTETQPTPLPLRGDTFLGVCEGIGQDFGFNPNWLRVAFASVFLASPVIVVATYLGLGVLVAVTRTFSPDKAVASGVETAVPHAAPQLASELPSPAEERELIAA